MVVHGCLRVYVLKIGLFKSMEKVFFLIRSLENFTWKNSALGIIARGILFNSLKSLFSLNLKNIIRLL